MATYDCDLDGAAEARRCGFLVVRLPAIVEAKIRGHIGKSEV